jgi:hypothetical protein
MTTMHRCSAHPPPSIVSCSVWTPRAGVLAHTVDWERRRWCGGYLDGIYMRCRRQQQHQRYQSRHVRSFQTTGEKMRVLRQALRQGYQFNVSHLGIVRDARAAGGCCTFTRSAAVSAVVPSVTSTGVSSGSARRATRGITSTQWPVMLGGPRALWQAGDEEVRGQGQRRGDEQTIFALSSGAGRAGIAVLRVSGRSASAVQVPARGPPRSPVPAVVRVSTQVNNAWEGSGRTTPVPNLVASQCPSPRSHRELPFRAIPSVSSREGFARGEGLSTGWGH